MDVAQALEAMSKLATGLTVTRGDVIEAAKVITVAHRAGKLGKRPKKPLDGPEEFARFWDKYPRKEARKDALKAWTALNPIPLLLAKIMEALERHCGKWAGKDEKFIPLPATWLRGARWEDQLPVTKQVDMTADPIYKNWPYNKPTNRPETDQEYRTRMLAMKRI